MHPTRFVESFLGLQLTDYQKYIFMNCWTASTAVILCSRATGKALALDTKIPVLDENGYSCWKTIKDLKVGDKIYDKDGKITTIIQLKPIIFNNYYKVEFNDGEVIKCNGEHLWYVNDRTQTKDKNKYSVVDTEYIYNNLKVFHTEKRKGKHDWYEYNFTVPINKPIEYNDSRNELPINPYVLGYYLGDGCKISGVMSCSLDDIEEATEHLKEVSITARWRKDKHKENAGCILVDFERDIQENGFTLEEAKEKSLKYRLKELENLLYDKHIPESYLYSSVENRLELLRGLLDTDGYIDDKGKCEFVQSNEKIAKDVCQLLRSLGIKCSLNHKITNYIRKDGTRAEAWRVYFAPTKDVSVFKLKRKKEKILDKLPNYADRKTIINVTKMEEKIGMRCITVDNKSGTFLCGENYTVTHNSFFSAPFVMTRSLLIPNHYTYYLGPSGAQSAASWSKVENLALGNIASAIGVTTVFLENVFKINSKDSGFSHNKGGSHVSLYNGSEINSLNSVPDNLRGSRSIWPF